MPPSDSSIELLQVRYERGTDASWVISGLNSHAIRPRESSSPGFYAIADEVVLFRPSTFGTTSYFLGQSIVPIVARVRGENVLRCIGTGFFVSCTGLLVTAAHVVSDPIERQYGGVKETAKLTWHGQDLTIGVMIALNPMIYGKKHVFREIEWASFLAEKTVNPLPIAGVDLRLSSDTAICKVAPLGPDVPHQPLTIIQTGIIGAGMAVGKTATAIGYGAMRNVEFEITDTNEIQGDFSFDLHVSTGAILERFADNAITKQVPTPGACFSASLQLPGGMSGSPIFDHEGIYVHGIASRGWVDEGGVSALGYGSMLAHSMHVPIEPFGNKTLLQLHGELEHGFAKIGGTGL